jgi:putative (di)nucleoside polyphosphate hydrolase
MRAVAYSVVVSPEVYRQAASVLLLREEGNSAGKDVQLLLLHKPRKRDAWQLPQGGMEQGESVAEAAFRELQEEAGVQNAVLLGQSEEVYLYDFPASFRKFRPDNVKGQQIAFIFARAPQDCVVTVDGVEVDRYMWVSIRNLKNYIHRRAYADLLVRLYSEAIACL